MNYHAKDRKGEIWIRGPSVFKGYLKDPVKTAETLTTDGWLKTGDIGSIDNRGNIFIIDRKKNIFKLAQGEYVAPEKLENIYTKSFFIAQMYVHGDSLQSELVAVVVPDLEYCVQFAMENGWLPSNTAVPAPAMIGDPAHPLMLELIKNPKLKQVIQQDLIDIAKQESLAGFEYIRGFHLEPELFSPATLLTPTFKLKRGDALVFNFD
jgi:long-chain acyl-CoA synthetase